MIRDVCAEAHSCSSWRCANLFCAQQNVVIKNDAYFRETVPWIRIRAEKTKNLTPFRSSLPPRMWTGTKSGLTGSRQGIWSACLPLSTHWRVYFPCICPSIRLSRMRISSCHNSASACCLPQRLCHVRLSESSGGAGFTSHRKKTIAFIRGWTSTQKPNQSRNQIKNLTSNMYKFNKT